MKRAFLPSVSLLFASLAAFSLGARAQQASPGITAAPGAQAVPPNVIAFSDSVEGQPDGVVTVTFALYPDQQSATAAWTETQVVQVTQGKYTALLGSTSSDGIPPDAFAADQAHWLGVQINGTEKRYLLVSVPYAMKAMEAERLGGLLPSQFVTTSQLQTLLQSTAASGSSTATGTGTKTASGPLAAASLNPAQPATDFTDSDTSEVLLVTQQGTGFAIHAISAGDAALFAENSTATGTALKAVASSTTGATIGILGQSASPDGIAGVFDNTGNGKILSLRGNGAEVTSVDQFGGITTNGFVQAGAFQGNGFGLFNIPNSATTATTATNPNTIVLRDNGGGISANTITANVISGNGIGLFNVPNSATTATTLNTPNTIVERDNGGGISANQITANFISGSGAGLFNIPNSATTATVFSNPNTIVLRDNGGGISANQVTANLILGNGAGLFNIPNSATTATSVFLPNTIVARDANGSFGAMSITTNNLDMFAGRLTNSGITDFSAGTETAPVQAVTSANTPGGCNPSKELLIKTDATPGQQLFVCNATGNGWVLVGDGASGSLTSVGAGDSSISVGGTSVAPVISVANGGITSAKLAPNAVTSANIASGSITTAQLAPNAVTSANLAPNAVTSANIASGSITTAQLASGAVTSANLASNAVTSANIADGSLTPAKIAGTAATLGANNFLGIQSIVGGLNLDGDFHFQGQNNSSIYLRSLSGVAVQIDQSNTGPAGVGIAIRSDYDGVDSSSTFGRAVYAASTQGTGVFAEGGTTGVQAQSYGVALSATSIDTSGTGTAAVFTNLASGKILSGLLGSTEVFNVDTSGNLMASGALYTKFPDSGTVLNGPVKLQNGAARATIGIDSQGGVIGIAISSPDGNGNVAVAYSGVANCGFDGVNGLPQPGDFAGISRAQRGACTDLGLSPQPGAQVLGRILLPANKQLSILAPVLLVSTQGDNDPTISINTGAGLTGGPIGSTGTISIANAGITNAMLQNSSVTVNAGPGLTGSGTASLGGSVTLSNAGVLSFNGRTGNILPAPGDYSFNQLNGSVSPSQLPTTTAYTDQSNFFSVDQTINGRLTANSLATGSLTGASGSFSGSSNANQVQSVLSVTDAATSGGVAAISATSQNNPAAIFTSFGPTSLMAGTATHAVFSVGDTGVTVIGTASATSFSGDGSALTNVNASSVGGIASTNLATTAALTSETTARQSAEAVLATSISAETAARQSDVGNLQSSINNVSAADAKLAAPNTFTASNTFTGGTQDFSGAGATLPVRTLPSAQTPASCIASKELLIKTDAPAGQQLFLCDAGGTTWNLVGDGASGGVTSFNGRNGTVSPSSGDYSFGQISGSLAASQLPALTGDVTEAAGTGVTMLAATGVTPGAYSKVTVDLAGRVVSGAQALFSDLGGSAAPSQLPANVVYNNQVNTFSAGQTVNGNLSAALFIGNGAGLSNVNAATLNNLASSSFAQLGTNNTFTGSVTASSFSGNGSGLTSVNAATVNSLQMLKLTASIAPASVSARTCSEQSFTVTGVNSGDVLLSAQIATHSPGTNIAIGGVRISAANTVAIQFCNVSGSNSTPAAGTYTFAVMR